MITVRCSLFRYAAFVLILGLVVPVAAQQTWLSGVGFLSGDEGFRSSNATSVSADGKIVCGRVDTGFIVYQPFIWKRRQGMRGVEITESYFSNISGNGLVMTGSQVRDEGVVGYYWTRQTGMNLLPDLPGGDYYNGVNGINWNGDVIVGTSKSDRSELLEAYRWSSDEGIIGLGDFSGQGFWSRALDVSANGSIVVGDSSTECGTEAFRWTVEEGMVSIGDLSGGQGCSSQANAISADGRVIVGRGVSEQGHEAFRWTEETGMVGLGDIEGGQFESHALSVSADGSVIVGYGTPDVNYNRDRAYVWESTRGMMLLRDRLHEFGVGTSDWRTLDRLAAVSGDAFTVVGWGTHFDGSTEGFVAHFPCLEFCDHCTMNEKLKATCSTDEQGQRAITAKLRRAKPGATVRFVLDYYQRTTEATIGPDGRATVTWTDIPPGPHHVGLKECDASADVECP